MDLQPGTRVRFAADNLGALPLSANLTYDLGECGTLGKSLTDIGPAWYAVIPDRQPDDGPEVYVPVHVSMFELI